MIPFHYQTRSTRLWQVLSMKCSKCHSEMSECYQRDSPIYPLRHGWICSTLGCERFGLFLCDEAEGEMNESETKALRIIEHMELIKQEMEALRNADNKWDKRALSIALTELETSQLWLANARPD